MSSPNDYTVGWICALTVEAVAATVFLDERLEGPITQDENDTNNYKFGKIRDHFVVIATLPKGEYGIAVAASVAKDLTRSFPNVRIGLMVGIGGGAPSPKNDIRLGDVVVSTPEKGQSGIFQYDYGKSMQDGSFQHTRALDQPLQLLRTAVGSLEVEHEIEGNGIEGAITEILEQKPNLKRKYGRPSDDTDILFRAGILHAGGDSCDTCKTGQGDVVSRESRNNERTSIHHGIIASANTLVKNAILRDNLAAQNNVLCFEMEAAGLINGFSCLVIRGICDYSDSHKNKSWQGYAAMAAAAYAKQIVSIIRPPQLEDLPRLGKVEAQIRQIAQTAQDVRSHQEKEDDLRILTWLSSTDFGRQQTDHLSKWQKGTVQWLLDSPKYQKWAQEKGQILFCPGIPGAGKTVCASVVVNDLTQRFSSDTNIGIVCVYCSYKQKDSQQTINLLGGILKQLCQRRGSVPQDVRDLYTSHQNGDTGPQCDGIMKALKSHLGDYSHVMVVVDALDEWQPPQNDRFNFVDELLHIHSECQVNLFVTSRFVPAIEAKFQGYPCCQIRANQDDIYRYIEDYHWPLLSLVGGRPDLQQDIKSCVCQAANGMFLLAQFYLTSLEDKTTAREVKDALRMFQNRAERKDHDLNLDMLAEAYDEVMVRINQQGGNYRRIAHQVLSWVCYANRELYVREIQGAIAVRDHEFDVHEDDLSDISILLSVCCGIVVIGKATKTIQLVHYTAQDYFILKQERWFPDVQSYLAEQCINYLSLEKFKDGLPVSSTRSRRGFHPAYTPSWYAFYEYAAVYWSHHVRRATISAANVDQAALDLLHSGRKIDAAMKIQLRARGPDKFPNLGGVEVLSVNGLHLAAFCGLDQIIPLLMATFGVNSKDGHGHTALSWASKAGWCAVVERLLLADADFDAVDDCGQTSLHLAAQSNHIETVQLLIDAGVDVNAVDFHKDTALHLAAQSNHVETVQLLIDAGVDVNAAGSYGNTALHWAARANYNTIAHLLLVNGARFDISNKQGQTALMKACNRGHQLIVESLLQYSARPDIQDATGQTALMKACNRGHQKIVESLLQHNVSLDIQDFTGETALMEACEKGHQKIVEALLQHN
ncbi:hypothetical protein DER45DRAFT_523336, partial [Fusarium avenaceum]